MASSNIDTKFDNVDAALDAFRLEMLHNMPASDLAGYTDKKRPIETLLARLIGETQLSRVAAKAPEINYDLSDLNLNPSDRISHIVAQSDIGFFERSTAVLFGIAAIGLTIHMVAPEKTTELLTAAKDFSGINLTFK